MDSLSQVLQGFGPAWVFLILVLLLLFSIPALAGMTWVTLTLIRRINEINDKMVDVLQDLSRELTSLRMVNERVLSEFLRRHGDPDMSPPGGWSPDNPPPQRRRREGAD